jgi:hypothetical protein
MSLAGALLGALLPAPERDAVARRLGGDAARASGLLGAVQFVVGVDLVHGSAMAYLTRLADEVATEFLGIAMRRSVSPEDALGLTWGGAVVWAGWLLRPTTWLLSSVPIVGLLRVATYLATREPIAEPAVWAALRLAQRARAAAAAVGERIAFASPAAADGLEREGDDLLVYTPRARPDWTSAATIEVDGRFFRVASHDEAIRLGGRRHRYRLTLAGEHEVIRRFLRYEPPPPR